MKVDLTPSELKQVMSAVEGNPVRRWMKNKEAIKFEVGDVLIKLLFRRDYQTKKESWVPENINSDNKMAQRYVYVYEDDCGIGYMKQLRVASGSLGKELYCMTDFDYTSTRFEVDPEYAEHVLLDADFDIKQIHKQSLAGRKVVTKMNRKIGVKPKTLQEFNDYFDKVNVGDTFWTSSDFTGRYVQEYKITAITKVTVSDLNRQNDWDWRRYQERAKDKGITAAINSTYSYKITYTGTYASKDKLVVELGRDVLYFTQRPAEEQK